MVRTAPILTFFRPEIQPVLYVSAILSLFTVIFALILLLSYRYNKQDAELSESKLFLKRWKHAYHQDQIYRNKNLNRLTMKRISSSNDNSLISLKSKSSKKTKWNLFGFRKKKYSESSNIVERLYINDYHTQDHRNSNNDVFIPNSICNINTNNTHNITSITATTTSIINNNNNNLHNRDKESEDNVSMTNHSNSKNFLDVPLKIVKFDIEKYKDTISVSSVRTV